MIDIGHVNICGPAPNLPAAKISDYAVSLIDCVLHHQLFFQLGVKVFVPKLTTRKGRPVESTETRHG